MVSIEEEWKNWVINQPIDENVKLVPAAFIKTQSEWDVWWKMNEQNLLWDEDHELYLANQSDVVQDE